MAPLQCTSKFDPFLSLHCAGMEGVEGIKYCCVLPSGHPDEVLERGLGIPIMLSLLFMAVSRRVGLTLHPSNLPGHFMLRLEVGR